ncbi:MAG: RloB domain-containing protein [Prevotellaceae bacterium]|nr:RloB domain-containing protein [Candidatus Minthosoma equi]
MESRDLKDSEQKRYFASFTVEAIDTNEGTRDMFPLAPFVISGGKNTERYYFLHVNELSDKYKFTVKPEYFGDESDYTTVFPYRISRILKTNADAKIYCVFDMDAVFRDGTLEKHKYFVKSLKSKIEEGSVVMCDSMPSFEFWLLLHFVDHVGLLKNYSEVSQLLAPYLKPYFEGGVSARFKKVIKKEDFLKESGWVRKLLDEGRIEKAVERAKHNYELEMEEKGKHSYSMVFKMFE